MLEDFPRLLLPTEDEFVAPIEPPRIEPVEIPDEPTIIDETEAPPTSKELYAEWLIAYDPDQPGQPRLRVSPAAKPRMPLWGPDTSGIPKRGSRAVRLFRTEPETLFDAVRGSQGSRLRVLPESFHTKMVLDSEELHGEATLSNAFSLRSSTVRVSVRTARFNVLFMAVELRLASRGHPRRFFKAAHEAIDELNLPGRQ